MRYLCMVFFDEKKLDALSKTELQALDDESLAYDETLRKGGHLVAAQALQPIHAATTVRVRSGRVSVTDGPFAETNEQIGGFILIEARDLNEAIQLASKIPSIRLGGIEVRPIKELSSSQQG
ncbi:MAG TPA: YciI family protein [Acidobacteriaceae bacterium]